MLKRKINWEHRNLSKQIKPGTTLNLQHSGGSQTWKTPEGLTHYKLSLNHGCPLAGPPTSWTGSGEEMNKVTEARWSTFGDSTRFWSWPHRSACSWFTANWSSGNQVTESKFIIKAAITCMSFSVVLIQLLLLVYHQQTFLPEQYTECAYSQ